MSVQDLEHDLQFRRYSLEKQEQIRQLVCYATLMGLEGRDLISIGGTWQRSSTARRRRENIANAKYVWNKGLVNTLPTKHYWEKITGCNFTSESGMEYELTFHYRNEVRVKNKTVPSSKKQSSTNLNSLSVQISDYDCGNSKKMFIYQMLVAIHNKELVLP